MAKLPETLEELNIKYFKLMTGESIIAYTHDLDGETYGAMVGLEEPMLVKVDKNDEYTFTPWFPFTSGKVHMIDSYNILAESTVDANIKHYYMKLVLDALDTTPNFGISTNSDGEVLH